MQRAAKQRSHIRAVVGHEQSPSLPALRRHLFSLIKQLAREVPFVPKLQNLRARREQRPAGLEQIETSWPQNGRV